MGFHPAIAEPGELNTPEKFDYVFIDPKAFWGEDIRKQKWEKIVKDNMGLYAWFDGAYIMKRGYEGNPINVPPPKGLGLEMTLYNDQNFSHPMTTVPSPSIDCDWGSHSPLPGMSSDHFSVIWTGKIKVPRSGVYKFKCYSDDGSELTVDNKVVYSRLENKAGHATGQIRLRKGVHNIEMKYFEWAGVATITLKWKKPGKGNFERIPASAFGPPD